jgi:hypothetical protein
MPGKCQTQCGRGHRFGEGIHRLSKGSTGVRQYERCRTHPGEGTTTACPAFTQNEPELRGRVNSAATRRADADQQ